MSTTDIAKVQPTHGERFTNMVMKEFTANSGGELQVTSFQKKLIQNYFIKLDASLKEADRKRMIVKEDKRDLLPVTWDNVNMQKLAVDVISFSLIGLDPAQANHINMIPYKNNGTSKYDVTFIPGYKGIEIKAMKYGFQIPDDVIVELVFTNDKFKSIKKDITNRIEGYNFEIVDDFDRGEIRGGFYYHVFNDNPEKNKLKVLTLQDILKRRPEYASANFWGGEKDVWENGKKVGKEKVEGWYEEMCYKTVYRAAYNSITIDSEKIDEHFLKMMSLENENFSDPVSEKVRTEIETKAHKQEMTFEDAEVVNNQIGISAESIGNEQKEVIAEGPGY